MPCTDSLNSSAMQHEEPLSQIDTHSHDHDNEEDDCPPFCGCQCCGVNVFAPSTSLADIKEANIQDTYNDNYTYNYTFHFLGGVWHPPSIG